MIALITETILNIPDPIKWIFAATTTMAIMFAWEDLNEPPY